MSQSRLLRGLIIFCTFATAALVMTGHRADAYIEIVNCTKSTHAISNQQFTIAVDCTIQDDGVNLPADTKFTGQLTCTTGPNHDACQQALELWTHQDLPLHYQRTFTFNFASCPVRITFLVTGDTSVHTVSSDPDMCAAPYNAVGGISEAPDLPPSASYETRSDNHGAYIDLALGGVGIAALILVAAGGWAMRRRRS